MIYVIRRNIILIKRIRIIFLLATLLLPLPLLSQKSPISGKTYYYKQILKVHNGQKSKGDFSGQFICFNDQGCYDADKSGYTVNNGFLGYKSTANSYHTYSGDSFWGQANYYFSSDYNRLNITFDNNNIVYVYVRSTPPQGILTSSKIRTNVKRHYNPHISPVPLPYNGLNNNTYENSSNSLNNSYLNTQTDQTINRIKQHDQDQYEMYRRLYDNERVEADSYYKQYEIYGNASDLQKSKDCEARAKDYLEKADIWK